MLASAGLPIAFVSNQHRFANASFEYGIARSFEGRIDTAVFPMLDTGSGDYLLVAPGKHGAVELVRPFAGEWVWLQGSLIERDGRRMIETLPGTITRGAAASTAIVVPEQSLGPVDLIGEIVDTKCWLGVMNPGEGKVHRGCAARCISGGVPATLIARDRTGRSALFLLTDASGNAIGKAVYG